MLNQFLYDVGEAGEAGDQYIGLDRFGRVVDLLWQNGNDDPLDHFKYGYDRDGNRLYRTNVLDHDFDELYQPSGMLEDGGLDPAGQAEDQRYDRLNQLTAFLRGPLSDSDSDGLMDTVTTSARSQSWAMDALGNFSSVTTDSTTLNRNHDLQNRLTGVDSTPLTYDDNGNLREDDQGNEYTFDAWNRIVGVGEDEHHYAYDALGRRVREGDHTLYYSANWQVLEERDANDDVVYQYVWSPVYVDAMVARLTYPAGESMQSMSTIRDLEALEGIESSLMQMSFTNEPVEILYVLQDANFNVTSLVDASTGEVVERFVYDPYGRFDVLEHDWDPLSGSNHAWVYLHQGGRWDAAAELFNFRRRDYSPRLMRWVEQDPMSYADGANLYKYAANSPTSHVDPWGLQGKKYSGTWTHSYFNPQSSDGKTTWRADYEVEYDFGCKNNRPWLKTPPKQTFNVRHWLDTWGFSLFIFGVTDSNRLDVSELTRDIGCPAGMTGARWEVNVTMQWINRSSIGFNPGLGFWSVDLGLSFGSDEVWATRNETFIVDCCSCPKK